MLKAEAAQNKNKIAKSFQKNYKERNEAVNWNPKQIRGKHYTFRT